MGIILHKTIKDAELLVWEINQTADWFAQQLNFSPALLKDFHIAYSSPKSQKHWLASRFALKSVWNIDWQDLIRTETRRLYWPNSKNYLSLSHSGNKIALAKSTSKIGIDIQEETPKLERIAAKFIAKQDLLRFQKQAQYKDILHLHWCSKEAMFKAYIKGKVRFIEHLHLLDLDLNNLTQGQCTGLLTKATEEEKYMIHYQKLDNYWLSLAINQNL